MPQKDYHSGNKMNIPAFTYNSYFSMLYWLMGKGYELVRFDAANNKKEPHAIIRHDIDISTDKALELAILEHQNGINSTYFVMVSSDWYNVFTKENERNIHRIHEMGHEIGLHFDVTKCSSEESDIEEEVRAELISLSMITGETPHSISWHIPSPELVGIDIDFLDRSGINNAYSARYYNDYSYFSDSMMRWRRSPLDDIDPGVTRKVQILTHPVWYSERGVSSDVEVLKGMKDKKDASMIAYLQTIRPGLSI